MRAADRAPDPAAELAEHLDLIGREIRSGSSLGAALTHHGDPRLAATSLGANAADVRVVGHALELATRRGGSEAACLHHAAAALRERAALAHEARSHAAAAWASARLLTVVPAAFASWGMLTSASLRHAVTTPAGAGCALVGAGLNAAGWRWMRSVVGEVGR